MKITIYEPPKPKEEKEKELCLRLVPGDYAGVSLVAVDAETGETLTAGRLLTITEQGFGRVHCVSGSIPLPLDEEGRVKVVNP